jgi:hypothetical protein
MCIVASVSIIRLARLCSLMPAIGAPYRLVCKSSAFYHEMDVRRVWRVRKHLLVSRTAWRVRH